MYVTNILFLDKFNNLDISRGTTLLFYYSSLGLCCNCFDMVSTKVKPLKQMQQGTRLFSGLIAIYRLAEVVGVICQCKITTIQSLIGKCMPTTKPSNEIIYVA